GALPRLHQDPARRPADLRDERRQAEQRRRALLRRGEDPLEDADVAAFDPRRLVAVQGARGTLERSDPLGARPAQVRRVVALDVAPRERALLGRKLTGPLHRVQRLLHRNVPVELGNLRERGLQQRPRVRQPSIPEGEVALSARLDLQPGLARAVEQRPGLALDELRAELDRQRPPRKATGIDPSPDARPRLEHPDRDVPPGEPVRGGEPRSPRADHHHVHALVGHGRTFLQSRGCLVLAGSVVERPALVQSTVLSRGAAGVLVHLLQALPSGIVDALARGVAACAYALGIRRRVTLDNLAHAFPERSVEERRALARAAYGNMAR